MLKGLESRVKKAQESDVLPDWVSAKNVSLAAYEYIRELKKERLNYIKRHNQLKDYKKKGHYQISGSEIARYIGVATTTLISTSSYSAAFKKYLGGINEELTQAKDSKLDTHKRTRMAGTQQRKKDEIKQELKSTRADLEKFMKNNAKEQVEQILGMLPLPIKRKLGLDV